MHKSTAILFSICINLNSYFIYDYDNNTTCTDSYINNNDHEERNEVTIVNSFIECWDWDSGSITK